ncbi:MAG: pentapeptide repeat-containing protein, partial [Moorea sp. SIO2I5]|nr:pentapeptide repeat-containing protein [Moorena sp. SIO2I5]
GIDLSDANLSDASLKGAQLDYTLELTDWGSPNKVYRANLKGANLSNTIMPDGSIHQ